MGPPVGDGNTYRLLDRLWAEKFLFFAHCDANFGMVMLNFQKLSMTFFHTWGKESGGLFLYKARDRSM